VKTLAEAVVFLLEMLTTHEESGIDWQACLNISNSTWFELANASCVERQALTEAAAERLKVLFREPDEYGYTPRGAVTPRQRELLQSLADGSVWYEFDNPEAETEYPMEMSTEQMVSATDPPPVEDKRRRLGREFYDQLGPEDLSRPCKRDDCDRGAIAKSVLCKRHHFEMIQRRGCPFDH